MHVCICMYVCMYVYIYIYIKSILYISHTGFCEQKHPSGEEDLSEDKLSEHQIRGRRGVSAAGLQGQRLNERSVIFTDTGRNCLGTPLLVTLYL